MLRKIYYLLSSGRGLAPSFTLNRTETEADVTLGWDTASRCPYEGFGLDRFA